MGKLKQFILDIFRYWKKPKEGDFVPNKEIFNFGVGIFGTIVADGLVLVWGIGCLLIGAVYKISFRDLWIIGFIGMLYSFIYNPIQMIVTDNLGNVPEKTMKKINNYLLPSAIIGALIMFIPNSFMERIIPAFSKIIGWPLVFNAFYVHFNKFVFKKLAPKFGKFRSLIIATWLPCLIATFLIIYIPFNDPSMKYATKLWLLNCLFSFYLKAFSQQRGALQNVISPKAEERVKINTILTLLGAPAYAIMGILVPILATTTGGMSSYATYKVYGIIFVVIGIPLTLFMAFGVKDRIILEKKHVTNVNMFNGFRDVLKNKYLWIYYISDNLQAFCWGTVNIVTIVVVYLLRQDWTLGLVTTITGFFGFPGLFLAPLLIKKLGRRNVLFLAKGLGYSYFIFAFMAIKTNVIAYLYIGLILSNMFNQAGYIARDCILPDIWDYQQFKSGKRLESSMGILNTLGSPIVNLLMMTVPIAYAAYGFTNDWSMLYDPVIRSNILNITLILTLLGHTVGIIPYFFYDLTEKKHAEIFKELERRKKEKDAELDSEPLADSSIEENKEVNL